MGIELELGALLAFAILGQSTFARFEIETPAIRKIVKWATLSAVTLLLYRFVAHWCLLLPVFLGAAGTSFHVIWCERNGIDPWRATPHRRYYELRGWKWPYRRARAWACGSPMNAELGGTHVVAATPRASRTFLEELRGRCKRNPPGSPLNA